MTKNSFILTNKSKAPKNNFSELLICENLFSLLKRLILEKNTLMKKKLISISIIFLVGCSSSNDTLLQDQNELLQSKGELIELENSITSENSVANKDSETVIMDYTIGALIPPQNGGCSSITRDSNDNPGINNEGFGPDPIEFLGYKIRGFGKPTTSIHYSGIYFFILNKQKTITSSRWGTRITDNPKSQAISIEQVFEPNFTYEIKLTAYIEDIIYTDKSGTYDIERSEGRPTIKVQLKETPEIAGKDPCEFMSHVQTELLGVSNNLKQQKIDNYAVDKIYTFNFSPTVKTNSLVIYFLPQMSGQRSNAPVPQSTFIMRLSNIKITQKPFDLQYYSEDGGYRSSDNDDGRAGSTR